MKIRSALNWPLCGLILYLAALLVSGLVYASTQHRPQELRLTGVTPVQQDSGKLELALRGKGLQGKLQGYLSHDSANRRSIVGSVPIWRQAIDIEIVDNKLYVLNLDEGVRIFDLELPVAPEPAGTLRGVYRPWSIDADQRHLYLSALNMGVSVFNLASQNILYQIENNGTSFSTIHRKNLLFVANGRAGLSIYTLSDTLAARRVAQLALPGDVQSLAFYKDYILASAHEGGLHLIDIRDPARPRLLQTLVAEKRYERVVVVGDVVYAADKDSRIDLFTLTSAGRLQRQARLDTYGIVRDFLLDGDRLFISESSYGVSLLDVSQPLRPRRVGYVGTPGDPSGLALYKDYLFVCSGSQGVQIIDTRRLETRNLPAEIDTPGVARDLVADGRWIYVADDEAGLQVIDREDLKNLKLVAGVPSDVPLTALVKVGDMLFAIGENQGIQVFDVRNPYVPRRVNQLMIGVSLSDLAVRGTSLFASSFAGKLLRIEISDPWHPWVAETLELPGRARRIALAGDDVYVAAEKAGLLVARFSPQQPGKLLAALTRAWPMNEFSTALGVTVRGGYAYLAQGEQGLQVVDISHPEQPREVRLVTVPGLSLDVGLAEGYIVLSSRWHGYFFFDIQNPANPLMAANIYHPHSSSGFSVEADLLYAPSRSSGISLLSMPTRNLEIGGSADLSLVFARPLQPGWYDLNVTDGGKLATSAAVIEIK